MTESKLSNDASASVKGTLYQLYVAVEKCFGMISGQKIIVWAAAGLVDTHLH